MVSAISNKLYNDTETLESQVKLSDIGMLKNGYAFMSNTYIDLGKYKIITIANVKGDRYIESENCSSIEDLPSDIQHHQILKENDILISMTGNVGRVSLCKNGSFLLNQRVGLFEVQKGANQEYVYQALSSKKFEYTMFLNGQGAAQMNITKEDIDNYTIPYSKNKVLIIKISEALKTFDEKFILEKNLLSILEKQKKYLLRELFI